MGDSNAWWVSSPGGIKTEDSLVTVWNGREDFAFTEISTWRYFRPIICIKTPVFQNKYESTLVDE